MAVGGAGTTVNGARRTHPFKGRTLSVINDLSLAEQWYLYQKTRELKQAIRDGKDLSKYRLQNSEAAVYTIFMEDSTRTKESFRNAAEFHGMKVNVFDAKTSSFQKNETVTDTIKMLCGYSIGQSIFVIRSKIEGLCTWMEEGIDAYAKQRGFPRASFVNAGDGAHEHPSQELLDEFSFLEHKGWDTSSIHLVLLGDLYHGRTVHSKVDGLRLYRQVNVDLVAPAELALPKMYEKRMIDLGFNVRIFSSIEEYLSQPKVANMWYFTRLQLERMGEKVLDKQMDLRRAVTFQREFLTRLPENTRFFHPLPRDARHPTLPFWLDGTNLNGWDQQSQNGYFTRIVLLGMLGGHFGEDFDPSPANLGSDPQPVEEAVVRLPRKVSSDSIPGVGEFIAELSVPDNVEEKSSERIGLRAIRQGMVIENIAKGQSIETIWGAMYMVRSILGLTRIGGQGVHSCPAEPTKSSGVIAVPNFNINTWDMGPLRKLAAMAPGTTLNVVEDGCVVTCYELQTPPRIFNFPDISCKNRACVSHSSNMQHEVPPYFLRVASRDIRKDTSSGTLDSPIGSSTSRSFSCKYCEKVHDFWEIWDYTHHEDLIDYTL